MGGYFSGRRYGARSKGLTDGVVSVDVRFLDRFSYLMPGVTFRVTIERGGRVFGSICGKVGREVVCLDEEVRGCAAHVGLQYTCCNYGGKRPWFGCPHCDRRSAILYTVSGSFWCRKCAGLAYRSQREDAATRGATRAARIRKRLGGSGALLDPLPEKPPGMHWETYSRLIREVRRLECASLEALARDFGMLMPALG